MFVIILVASLLVVAALPPVGAFRFLKRPASAEDRSSYRHHRPDEPTVPQVVFGMALPGVCLILLLVIFGLWAGLNIGSKAEVAGMEAFYYETIQAYEYTITRTGTVEISAAQPGLLDVAYLGQAGVVGLRIVELRDEVAHFNRRLRWYATFESDPIASPFLASIPDDMKPITITDLEKLQEAAAPNGEE